MSHIGIKRFGAGHRQHDRAEQNEAVPGMVQQQIDRVARVDSQQDRRVARDLQRAENPDHAEPQDHDRAEIAADESRAAPLDDEQGNQQQQSQRHHIGFKRRGCDFQPLNRAQHGNRRCDDAVAVEQRGADQPGPHDPAATPGGRGAQGQHHQRENAALAAIARPHHDKNVFDGDDQRQRPGDQREHSEHAELVNAGILKALFDGVERRGADVAIDDAERRDRQVLADPPARFRVDDRGIGHLCAQFVRQADARVRGTKLNP